MYLVISVSVTFKKRFIGYHRILNFNHRTGFFQDLSQEPKKIKTELLNNNSSSNSVYNFLNHKLITKKIINRFYHNQKNTILKWLHSYSEFINNKPYQMSNFASFIKWIEVVILKDNFS